MNNLRSAKIAKTNQMSTVSQVAKRSSPENMINYQHQWQLRQRQIGDINLPATIVIGGLRLAISILKTRKPRIEAGLR